MLLLPGGLVQHRNGSMLTDFLVNGVIGHKTLGMGSPYVDGFYIDDEVLSEPTPQLMTRCTVLLLTKSLNCALSSYVASHSRRAGRTSVSDRPPLATAVGRERSDRREPSLCEGDGAVEGGRGGHDHGVGKKLGRRPGSHGRCTVIKCPPPSARAQSQL